MKPVFSQDLVTPHFVSYLGSDHPRNQQSSHALAFLAMNLNFEPIQKLREAISAKIHQPLKGHSEAHITIVSPPDLTEHFAPHSIEDLSLWSQEHNIQSLPFKVLGLGKASLPGHPEKQSLESYFLVIESASIQDFRRSLFEKYSRLRSLPDTVYEPHITIGFTERDLHAPEGITKGPRSLIQAWSEGL